MCVTPAWNQKSVTYTNTNMFTLHIWEGERIKLTKGLGTSFFVIQFCIAYTCYEWLCQYNYRKYETKVIAALFLITYSKVNYVII